MKVEPIVLIWREETPTERCRWAIRGIKNDGTMYGELTFYEEMRHARLEGRLAPADLAEIHCLVKEIQEDVPDAGAARDSTEWQGLLGVGSYNNDATIILHYRYGDEELSKRARNFLRIGSLLRPYVERQMHS
jgi:hypothetical protein